MKTELITHSVPTRVPGHLDRYPAKMVARLAEVLVSKYVSPGCTLLDPFCGSGAILAAGKANGIDVFGLDLNPYAVLLSQVKLNGFEKSKAEDLCGYWIAKARTSKHELPIRWSEKNYWFTDATLTKYERLRYVGAKMGLKESR